MSIFRNPGYLNLARQFMAGGRPPGNPYAGRYPDMMGLSRSPTGAGMMQKVLQQMKRRQATGAGGQPQRQVKRETTEYYNGEEALSNVGRRP